MEPAWDGGRPAKSHISLHPPHAVPFRWRSDWQSQPPPHRRGHSGRGHDPEPVLSVDRPDRCRCGQSTGAGRSCKRLAARSLLQRRPAARYCRTRATASELLSFTLKGWGACPDTGTSTMIGKMIVGLAAVAIVSVGTTMSASAQQMSASAQQKKITVAIPRQVCEMLNVDTQNWGRQTVQLCGPPGGPRGQATIKQPRLKPMTPGK
jgi:hypothetical protein